MKLKSIMLALVTLIFLQSKAQVKFGNWMYDSHKSVDVQSTNFAPTGRQKGFSENNFQVNPSQTIVIKTMYNLKPDAFVAVFSLSQEGEEAEEVDSLMRKRILAIAAGLRKISAAIEVKEDFISFVPLYEQILEKKVFGKNTYVEKPKGFELKKNVVILFQKASQMDVIFSTCAKNEVYDFVRIDFVSTKMAAARAALVKSSDSLLKIQIKRYEGLLDINMEEYHKTISEGFKVVYPAERYLDYVTFGGTSYFLQKYNMKEVKKNLTKHYIPIIDNEFNLVINPVTNEPVIQVMYNINLFFREKPVVHKPATKPEKEFFWITPTGEVKKLPIN